MAARRALVAALAAGLLAAPAGAEDSALGAAFLNAPLSIRQLGMGNTGIGGDDLLRAWSNPALLAARESGGELALNGGSYFMQTTGLGAGAGTAVSPKWSLAALFCLNGFNTPEVGFDGYETGGELNRTSMGLAAVAAYRHEWFRGGVTIKTFRDEAGEDREGGVAGDIGVAAVFKNVSVGFSARNLSGDLRSENYWVSDPSGGYEVNVRESLSAEMRAGVAYRYEPYRLTGALEFAQVDNPEGSMGLGVEWWASDRVALRAGTFGIQTSRSKQFTMGLTALFNRIGLDFAVATHPLGATTRAGISYALEPGQPREPKPARSERAPVRPAKRSEAVPPGEQLNMAVADLEPQNVSSGDSAVIADMLRNELVKTGAYNIVEKKNMDKLLAEQAFQQTGCTSEECAVKLGKLLNVQRIVVGSFGRLLNKYYISVRVINVETGKIDFGESARGETVEQIEKGVQELAIRIAQQVR